MSATDPCLRCGRTWWSLRRSPEPRAYGDYLQCVACGSVAPAATVETCSCAESLRYREALEEIARRCADNLPCLAIGELAYAAIAGRR